MSPGHFKQLCTLRIFLVLMRFHFGGALPVLSIQPENMTITRGETVRFRCRVEPSPASDVSVSWFRQTIALSSGRVIHPDIVEIERYSVIGETSDDFDLQIIDVKRYDESTFKCRAMDSGGLMAISQPVYLLVQYPPGDVKCSSEGGTFGLEIGTAFEALCILREPGVPDPDLAWITSDGQNVSNSYEDPDYRGFKVFRFRKNVTIDDNGKRFICVVRHPLLAESKQCEVGPLDVFHAPMNATIASHNEKLHLGDDLLFHCMADVNPSDDVTIMWSTEPEFNGKTILTEGGAGIFFSNAPHRLNGTILICNATNARGYSVGSIGIVLLARVTEAPPMHKPTSGENRVPTLAPAKKPETYLIAYILIGVIFVLLLAVVAILIIGRKWREPVIFVDVNDELCRRSLSGGGSLVFGSNSHIVLQRPNGERSLVQIHQGHKDGYSIGSAESYDSHHHGSASFPHDPENYPSDPHKAAKIEGTEFYRSAHTSRHNSIDSSCSNTSHYERSICSGSRPGTPTRSQDPLPPRPSEAIPMTKLSAENIVALEDTEHHADRNYYMNTPTKKTNYGDVAASREQTSPAKRESGEHNYEDITPVSKRKLYDQDLDTGEDDFSDSDRPRVTPEIQFGENADEICLKKI